MIEREITGSQVDLFRQYPFATVTGPRQSSKTMLCRETLPHLAYANLEEPDQRQFAASDPRGFLARLDGSAIIDEVQRVPELLSYLQATSSATCGGSAVSATCRPSSASCACARAG